MRFSPRLIVLTALSFLALVPPAEAQYMYLDANGDGVWSSADQLNPDTTTVLVWLNTNHDRDGSTRVCNDHTGAASTTTTLDMFSFDVALQATNGGTVSWGTFTSPGFSPLGTDFTSSTAATYHRVLPLGTTVSGLQLLGYVKVTKVSGSPGLILTDTPGMDPAWPGALTFGTDCDGSEYANTYVLGTDWLDVDGVAAPGDTMLSLSASVPSEVVLRKGDPVFLVGEFSSPQADSLSLEFRGLPAGLHAVEGESFDQKKQLRAYGTLADSVPDSSTFDVTWTASVGSSAKSARTSVRVEPYVAPSPQELETRILKLVTPRCEDSPCLRLQMRALGTAALPILARMLRDYDHRDHWHSIANAIGYIGDTSYFDTLRTLVRSRFRGTIDSYAFTAIQSAQGSLSAMAAISPRALDYLLASMNEADWNDLPWNVSGYTQRAVVRLLIKESQVSVAFTDVERARERIRTVPMPADSASSPGDIEVLWVQGLRTMSEKVRREGLIQVWAKEEGVTTEPGRGR